MTKNTGKEFELLVKEVYDILAMDDRYASVEHDVMLPSPDGERQIDVLIRSEVLGMQVISIVECRDYNKRLDITNVDALHSKMQGVGAHKAALVTRKEFSKGAKKKAKRLGISLSTLHEAKDQLLNIGFQIPVLVTCIKPTNLKVSSEIYVSQKGTSINKNEIAFNINDQNLVELFREALLSSQISQKPTKGMQVWKPPAFQKDAFIRDTNGKKLPVSKIAVTYEIQHDWFFGYLSGLDQTKTLVNLTEKSVDVIFKLEELMDFTSAFECFSKLSDVPKVKSKIRLSAVAVPEMKIEKGELSIIHKDTGNTLRTDISKK